MKPELFEDEYITACLKSGIEHYLGSKINKKVSVVEDPLVMNTYAIRCYKGKMRLDFLIVGFTRDMKKEEIADNLEECEFEEFPPESEGLKFFW